MKKISNLNTQRGNAFIFILLGVMLFAALSFTVARGMRSQNTSTLSERDAVLAATDLLNYIQQVERGTNRIRRRSVSENDISFDNSIATGYNHTPAQPDENKVFHPSGGAVSWRSPPEGTTTAGTEWFFTGRICIPDMGTGGAACDSDSTSNEELLMVLSPIDETVCEKTNAQLGITTTPTATVVGSTSFRFQGTFSDAGKLTPSTSYSTACYNVTGQGVILVHALLER